MATAETKPAASEAVEPQPGATQPVDQQWLRRNMWLGDHQEAIRQSGHDPAGVEAAYWELYDLLDEHFPDDDATVAPLTDYLRRHGASEDDVFRITVDTVACTFDVDARESDLPAAFASALRSIARRNLAVADAIAGARRPVNRSVCVALTAGGNTLANQTAEFLVHGSEIELAETGTNRARLKNLANQTGGVYVDIDRAGDLPDSIPRTERRIVRHERAELWRAPLLFLFFLGAITAEWLLRRKNQLV